MKSVLGGILIFLGVISFLFFAVYTFHDTTDERSYMKNIFDTGKGFLPFPQAENDHMRDFIYVLTFSRVFAAAAIVLGLWALIIPGAPRMASFFLVAIPVILAIIPFDKVFAGMHLLLFPQGNYTFPASSALIKIYPQSFFVTYGIVWGVLILLSGLALYLWGESLPSLPQSIGKKRGKQ